MVAMALQLAGAAGHRLLLEVAAPPPLETAAPGPDAADYSAQNSTNDGSYQVEGRRKETVLGSGLKSTCQRSAKLPATLPLPSVRAGVVWLVSVR